MVAVLLRRQLWWCAHCSYPPVHRAAADTALDAPNRTAAPSALLTPSWRTGLTARLVKVLAPIRNPANKKQSFDVLEVWGTIYKGQYRMHLIYAQLGGSCVLMGQEILEHASL